MRGLDRFSKQPLQMIKLTLRAHRAFPDLRQSSPNAECGA